MRNYAKRQLTWFRQTPNIRWIDVPADERSWETNERILDLLRRARTERPAADMQQPVVS